MRSFIGTLRLSQFDKDSIVRLDVTHSTFFDCEWIDETTGSIRFNQFDKTFPKCLFCWSYRPSQSSLSLLLVFALFLMVSTLDIQQPKTFDLFFLLGVDVSDETKQMFATHGQVRNAEMWGRLLFFHSNVVLKTRARQNVSLQTEKGARKSRRS